MRCTQHTIHGRNDVLLKMLTVAWLNLCIVLIAELAMTEDRNDSRQATTGPDPYVQTANSPMSSQSTSKSELCQHVIQLCFIKLFAMGDSHDSGPLRCLKCCESPLHDLEVITGITCPGAEQRRDYKCNCAGNSPSDIPEREDDSIQQILTGVSSLVGAVILIGVLVVIVERYNIFRLSSCRDRHKTNGEQDRNCQPSDQSSIPDTNDNTVYENTMKLTDVEFSNTDRTTNVDHTGVSSVTATDDRREATDAAREATAGGAECDAELSNNKTTTPSYNVHEYENIIDERIYYNALYVKTESAKCDASAYSQLQRVEDRVIHSYETLQNH